MSSWSVMLILVVSAAAFAIIGVLYARRHSSTLEDYIVARGSIGTLAAVVTLVASGMGGWILFSPAEAATRGGLPTLLGYSLGAAAPLIAFIPLGQRLRSLLPEGHTLTEYVWHRYGWGMYLLTLVVMLFYMFIYLAAEVTGMAFIVQQVAGPVPLWLTAAVLLIATLAYTAYGGLRASIFTDGLQTAIIGPFMVLLCVVGFVGLGGLQPALDGLKLHAPQLLQWGYWPGLQTGLTLMIAVLVANLFHQGYWQRVYAIRDGRALRLGFLIAAVAIIPIMLAMGFFGLVAVGLEKADVPSVALFSVILGVVSPWFGAILVLLGLALVMSSVDTLLNGIASIVAVDLHRALPRTSVARLLQVSRLATIGLALPVLWIASQGYSVLYLFLLADLVCAAAVFPVFYGLYSDRYTGRLAIWSTLAGLAAGSVLFPNPSFTRGNLLVAFVIASLVPLLVSRLCLSRQSTFDWAVLQQRVHLLAGDEQRS